MSPGTPPSPPHDDHWAGPHETEERIDVQSLHSPIMREQNEPRDGFEPIPIWMAGVFGTLLFWGGFYASKYSGDFQTLEGRYTVATASAAAKKDVDPVAAGKKLFAAQGCVSCHQATGQGVPGQYPPLAGSEWVLGSPSRLGRILINGLQGPVEVQGKTFNGNMPAFGEKLKDEQIAAVLTFLRQEWGNSAAPVPAEVIAATRAAIKGRATAWSEAELKAVTSEDAGAAPVAAASDGEKSPGKTEAAKTPQP
jgi:mono/diheme cytochrome c family protein